MHPRLIGTLTLLYGDERVAGELAKETLAEVWSRRRKIARMDGTAAGVWAYRCALKLAASRRRMRRALRRAGAGQGELSVLRKAVLELPMRERTALTLLFYADLAPDAAADVMGCTPADVEALAGEAVAALRDDLDEAADLGEAFDVIEAGDRPSDGQ